VKIVIYLIAKLKVYSVIAGSVVLTYVKITSYLSNAV